MAARTVTVRRSDSLAPGVSFPDITLLVNVEPTASKNLVNVVAVSGGGDATPDRETEQRQHQHQRVADPTIPLSLLDAAGRV